MHKTDNLSALDLLEIVSSEDECVKISSNTPFFTQVSYMLVSLECLIGSKYYFDLDRKNLLDKNIVVALGKKKAHYTDKRIEYISKYSQLWIDNCFTLDYTLKSLAKIYPLEISLKIRSIRNILKSSSYGLLGKMLSYFTHNSSLVSSKSMSEIPLTKVEEENINIADNSYSSFWELMNNQRKDLTQKMDDTLELLKTLLYEDDYKDFFNQYSHWKEQVQWFLLHNK